MTDIQASVIVKDNVDNKIEQKIKAIGIASDKTAGQLHNLQRAISGISSSSINNFSNAISSLSRTNLSNLHNQMQQLANVSSQLAGSLNNQSMASIKLQTAQAKLQQEQVKLQILQQRLQSTTLQTATAQQRLATASANLANAQSRASTSAVRNTTAQNQQIASTLRLQILQERLNHLQNRNTQISYQQSASLGQLVGTVFALATSFQTLIAVAQAGDEYQRLINKLSLVTDTAEQARNRLASLTDVALNSYAGLNSTVQLYTRLDLALKQMGGSASEAITMTQTLSKAVSLAGLTTAEANSALLQISQAFNKGKLDGDEFRTVMETMPPLADAIASKLGKTRGELLKLAPEGKITGQVMKEAVLDMAEAIDQKFAKLTPTIAMELQNLSTQAQVYFGSMFKDSGVASAMANAIKLVANNLDQATKLAVAFGIAVTVAMARSVILSAVSAFTAITRAIQGATGAMSIFGATMRATPLGWLITGVTALVSILDLVFDGAISKSIFPNFSQDQAKANDYISRLKEINSQLSTMSSIKLANQFTENVETQKELQKEISGYKKDLTDIERKLQKNVEIEKERAELIERMANSNSITRRYYQQQIDSLNYSLVDNNKLLAERDQKIQALEEAEKSNIELLKQQLGVYQQLQDRLDTARSALEKNKTQHHLTEEQQRTHEETVKRITSRFGNLKDMIDAVTKSLKILGVTDISLPLDQAVEGAKDKFDTTTKSKIDQFIAQHNAQMKVNTTSGTANDRARAELALLNDQAQLSTTDINGKVLTDEDKIKGVKSAYEEVLVLKQKEYELNRINSENKKIQAEHDRKRRQAERTALSEQKKKEEQIKRNTEEYERFVGKLDDEAMLLSQGIENYNKYNELYALRLKLQQRGMTISEQELVTLKQKIDANTRLKELAKEIETIESNSLARQKEQFNLKMASIMKSNTSGADKQVAFDSIMGDMGATYGVDQGVTKLTEQYQLHFSNLQDMRNADMINEAQYQMALQSLSYQTQEAIHQQRLANMEKMGGMWEVGATAIKSFEQNATNSIMNVLNGTQSIGDAMKGLAVTILNEVVRAIVQMGVRWVAMQATQTASAVASNATMASSAVATGATITSAMTPAATATAMATYGSSATMGMAAVMAGMAMIPTLLSMALSGKRQHGGSVRAGDLYQVGEGNAPEIYQSRSGRQYMIAGDNGRVLNNQKISGGGGGVNIVQNITINGNGQLDAETLQEFKESTKATIYEVLADEHREGGTFA